MKNIIDSSQVQAAFLIIKWFRAWKQKKAIKKIREISRDSLNLTSPRNEVLRKETKPVESGNASQKSIEFKENVNEKSGDSRKSSTYEPTQPDTSSQ
jgi:hypothetical protein